MNREQIAELLNIHVLEVDAAVTKKPLGELIMERLTQPDVTPQEAKMLYELTTDEIIRKRCLKFISDWIRGKLAEGVVTVSVATELRESDYFALIPASLVDTILEIIDTPITQELDRGGVSIERAEELLYSVKSLHVYERCVEIIDTPIFKTLTEYDELSQAEVFALRNKARSKKAYGMCCKVLDRLFNKALDQYEVVPDYFHFATASGLKIRIINRLLKEGN